MSTNLNYKQVANVTRRTWDKETYEKKAQDRLKAEEEATTGSNHNDAGSQLTTTANLPDEFVPAPKNAIGPEGSDRAFLKARSGHADIDSKVGTAEIISAQAAAASSTTTLAATLKDGGVTKTGVGWHCRVCDCFLKDSHTYLDHINGRKHQSKLGYSMRVERSTKDELQDTLQRLAEENKKSQQGDDEFAQPDFDAMVQAKDEQAQRKKEEKALRKKQEKERKRLEAKQLQHGKKTEQEPQEGDAKDEEEEDEEEEEEEPAMDPAIAAMMGFTSFGSGNKN